MGQQSISKPALIGVVAVVVLIFGALFWWKTQPSGDAAAYSEAVSKLEQSPEFQATQKAREEGKPVVEPNIPGDKVYQRDDH